MSEPRYSLVIDPLEKKLACVLLQAIWGGDCAVFMKHFGGGRDWLMTPTPDMVRVTGTDAEWAELAAKWRAS